MLDVRLALSAAALTGNLRRRSMPTSRVDLARGSASPKSRALPRALPFYFTTSVTSSPPP